MSALRNKPPGQPSASKPAASAPADAAQTEKRAKAAHNTKIVAFVKLQDGKHSFVEAKSKKELGQGLDALDSPEVLKILRGRELKVSKRETRVFE